MAWKKGDEGDLGDLGDRNFAELGENSDGFGDINSEGENKEVGEKREDENDIAVEGGPGESCECKPVDDGRNLFP